VIYLIWTIATPERAVRSSFADGRIVFVIGEVGAGKTWYAVHQMLEHMSLGGTVYTNIQLQLDPWWSPRFRRRFAGVKEVLWRDYSWVYQEGQYVHIDSAAAFTDLTSLIKCSTSSNVMVVIDEALEGWDTAYSSKNELEKIRSSLSFLRHSRKYRAEIYILSQSLSDIISRVRNKATDIVFVRDMGRYVLPRIRIRLPGFSRIIWAQWRDGSGKHVVRNDFISRRTRVGECYDTSQTLSVTGSLPEVVEALNLMDYRRLKVRFFVYGSVISCVLSFLFLFLFSSRVRSFPVSSFSSPASTNAVFSFSPAVVALSPTSSVVRIASSVGGVYWCLDGEEYFVGKTTPRGLVVYTDPTGFIVHSERTNYVYTAFY